MPLTATALTLVLLFAKSQHNITAAVTKTSDMSSPLSPPTLAATIEEIEEYWRKKEGRKKNDAPLIGTAAKSIKSNPNVACTLCYFDVIEFQEMKRVVFQRKSIRKHVQDNHADIGIVAIIKNVTYFGIEDEGDGKILNGDIERKQDMLDAIKKYVDKKKNKKVIKKTEKKEANEAWKKMGFIISDNKHNKNIKNNENDDASNSEDNYNVNLERNDNDNNQYQSELDANDELTDESEILYPDPDSVKVVDDDEATLLNSFIKYSMQFLPAMKKEIVRGIDRMDARNHRRLEMYENRFNEEIKKMQIELSKNKVIGIKRTMKIKHYNDCLIVYGPQGFEFADILDDATHKIGFCSICSDHPSKEGISFRQNGRKTGEWFVDRGAATKQQIDDLRNFVKRLDYHYYDKQGSIYHRGNALKLDRELDTKKVLAFCCMARAFARVLALGVGWINYEAFIEDYSYGGSMVGNQFHSRKYCDKLIVHFFDDRLNQITNDLHRILPATGCTSPLATAADKSTDQGGNHECQIIGYLKDGVKVYAEFGLKQISNKEDDEKTHGTRHGLSESLIDSLYRVKLSKNRLQYSYSSQSNDGEYVIKGYLVYMLYLYVFVISLDVIFLIFMYYHV